MKETAAKIYGGIWAVLVTAFKVPERPPEPPIIESGEDFDSFRPAPHFLKYMRAWFWILTVLLFPFCLAVLFIPNVIYYIALHLRYDTTWYVMTDRSLRIRRGIWIIHEMTITFENVQNLSIHQGPLQRLFGISSLNVETAGAGGNTQHEGIKFIANRGVVEGIADAESLRDRIMGRMQASKTTGLGDHDEQAGGWTDEHLTVLREIRDAVA